VIKKLEPATICDIFKRIPEISSKPYLVADKTVSYGELYDHAGKMASFFIDHGIQPGDCIVISSRKDTSTIMLFLSALASGITAVVIDPDTAKSRAESYLRRVSPRALFLDKKIKEKWDIQDVENLFENNSNSSKPTLFKKLLGRQPAENNKKNLYPDFLKEYLPGDLPDRIDQDTDAYIVFTSGTTSAPKGVRITHKSLFSHLSTLSRQLQFDSNSRCLNIQPLFNVGGIVDGVMGAIFNLSTLYRPVEFSVQNIERYLDAIYTHRITHVKTVPTMLGLMYKFGQAYSDAFETEDLKVVYCSGALLDQNIWEEFQNHFKVRVTNFYGLTESVTGGLFCGPDEHSFLLGSVGLPVDCDAKLINSDGREVGFGEVGELLLRGDNIMKGYLNDPEETGNVLKNNWFHTGDLALKEESGHYRIKGRIKSMIVTGGTNVMPEEINEILLSHERVLDAATFGLPDNIWGEIVVCAIVPEKDDNLSETDILKHCRDHIVPMKIPRKVYLLDSIPRVASGKIQYSEIKKHVMEHFVSENQTEVTDRKQRILATAARAFKVSIDELDFSSNTENMFGWDSLTHLELITELEQEFDIELSTKEIMQITNLNEVLSLINEKRQ